MVKLTFGLPQSLDGYVDHQHFASVPTLFRHFLEHLRSLDGVLYGRRTYEIMRYWEESQSDWGPEQREYAQVWCSQPKWVVSRSLKSVGPNTNVIDGDLEAAVRGLRDRHDGEISVAGPRLAQSLGELGLVDEYRLYFCPIVLGGGTPFFTAPRQPLRLVASDQIGDDVIRLTYVPA